MTAIADAAISEQIRTGTDAWDIFREMVDQLADGVYFVDTQRRISFWSKGAERITGFAADQVQGTFCQDNLLQHVDGSGLCLCKELCPLAATLLDGQSRAADVFLHHKDGHRMPVCVRTTALRDRTGRIIGGIETFHDNSARQADLMRIRELEELALIDSLTGIANRRHADEMLVTRLSERDRRGLPFGVILADIDRFKLFNDNYGHPAGDKALRLVARTLSLNSRPFDTVCRWGGEEFLIIAGASDGADLRTLAERLRVLVQESSVVLDDRKVKVTISAGAAMATGGDTAEGLLARADNLLYSSKAAGRNRCTFES